MPVVVNTEQGQNIKMYHFGMQGLVIPVVFIGSPAVIFHPYFVWVISRDVPILYRYREKYGIGPYLVISVSANMPV